MAFLAAALAFQVVTMGQVRPRHAATIVTVLLSGLIPWVEAYPQTSPQPVPAASAAKFDGRKIAAVEFEPQQQPLETSRLEDILNLHPGEVYTSTAVRDSIEHLYATGRYDDIQVDATDSPSGVSLRYVTRGSWFIGHVGFEGNLSEPPSASQLLSASGLELGTPFDEPQVAVAEATMLKLLRDNGFFSASVTHDFSYEAEHQQVHITFTVVTGKRAHYTAPNITGSTAGLTEKQIAKATKWHRFLVPGYRSVAQNRTRDGVAGVRRKFQDADRLLATVTLNSLDPENKGRAALPRITIEPGPVVEVVATGAKISRGQLRKTIPVFEEHTVDRDLLDEGTMDLREYLQARGYFDAVVSMEEAQTSDGRTRIEYSVVLGTKHRLEALTISGNKYFDTHTIRERMLVAPRSFELRSGRYSEALRRRDEQVIADLYHNNGFRDVKITSGVVDDYLGKHSDLAATFQIEEGNQYRVGALEITGNEKLSLDTVKPNLTSEAGQVFSEFNVSTDRDTVLRYYGSNGFPNATFQWSSVPGPQPYTFNVRFLLTEGPHESVREIVITGLSTTRPELVQHQLAFKPGDPLSPSAMADTQRRLYDLGIFAGVNLAVQNPDGVESARNVLYDMEEASRYSITTGVGAEFARIGGSNSVTDLSNPGGAPGFSPRISFNVSRLNFLGRGQTLGFQSKLSTLQKRVSTSWFIPRVYQKPNLDVTFSVLYDDTHDVRTFQSKREEASAQVAHRISKPLTAFYRITWRHVDVSNLKIDPLLLPLLAQSERATIASFNLIHDRRDDPVDPHKGIYNTLDLGLAPKFLGSQTNFIRIFGRNATYHRIGEKIVFARETQLGFEPAFGATASHNDADAVPLPERFYGGGGSTLRAFPENQAGPRDLLTGFPLGGTALFFNSVELRFPLHGANINGVLFEDAGNVYSNPGSLSFRVHQRDITDFNYMVHAAGFGIRYKTPVGPIRIDLAYSINPPQYNGFSGSYPQLVQCSQQNNCQASHQQISHFQFFFSIGQAF
jgi:outer membrane protein assembly complex protein YaeT